MKILVPLIISTLTVSNPIRQLLNTHDMEYDLRQAAQTLPFALSYSSEGHKIKRLVWEILQGNTSSIRAALTEVPFASSQQIKSKTFQLVTDKIKKIAELTISTLPAPYGFLAQQCMQIVKQQRASCHNGHYIEEQKLQKLPLIRLANQIAFQKIVGLLLIMHSPQAKKIDRLRALLAVNRIALFGKKGALLQAYLSKNNVTHFSHNGFLRKYDVERNVENKTLTHKELALFLKKSSNNYTQYLSYIKQAMKCGISDMFEYTDPKFFSAKHHSFWRYTKEFLQQLTGIQPKPQEVVNPETVAARTANADLILFVESESNQHERQTDELLKKYAGHSYQPIFHACQVDLLRGS